MSRAFTREDDTRDAVVPRPASPLPPGTRNYLTLAGAQQLRRELSRLVDAERPALMASTAQPGGPGADATEALQAMENRIAYLQQSLASAQVVSIPELPHDTIHFGASVTVRDQHRVATTYRIVGVDETNLDRNEVSWLAPIARTLLNARLGQTVPFTFPSGTSRLEIIGIRYE